MSARLERTRYAGIYKRGSRYVYIYWPSDIKRYAAGVAGRRRGDRTVSRDNVRLALAPVKALLATAVEEDLLDSNPAAGLRIAQAVGDVPEPMSLGRISKSRRASKKATVPLGGSNGSLVEGSMPSVRA